MSGSRSTRWVFTINNYGDDDIARLDGLASDTTYLVYGRETAATGTPHLQGFVIYPRQVRFSTVRDSIGGHIEVARGTSQQAAEYCKKENNFTEHGTLPQRQGRRTDWEAFVEWLQEHDGRVSVREIARSHPGLYLRYGARCLELARHFAPRPDFGLGDSLRAWQGRLSEVLVQEPDDRSVNFCIDPEGNAGKSWFCNWYFQKNPEDTQVLRIGKRDDLAYAIDENARVFLFDIPRGQMEFLRYEVLEMIKDRMIFSPKYASVMKVLSRKAHVVVFGNENPDMNALTEDRYNFIEM